GKFPLQTAGAESGGADPLRQNLLFEPGGSLVGAGVGGATFLLQAGEAFLLVATQPFADGVAAGLTSDGRVADAVVQGVLHQVEAEIKAMVFRSGHGKVRHRAHTIPSLE